MIPMKTSIPVVILALAAARPFTASPAVEQPRPPPRGDIAAPAARPFATPDRLRRERFAPWANRVFARVPSSAGGESGIAVGVMLPKQPRYAAGAPVAIHVDGGVQAGSARGRPEYVEMGFVQVNFAFPGGGARDEVSGGTYDFRGPQCIRALADVILFATGRKADREGRRIGQVASGLTVLTNNCGLIGSSHGGNACGMAMALHGGEFPDLAWYASMESPYGEGAANIELGGHESGVNPAYDPRTGVLDLSRLAWSADLQPGLPGRRMPDPVQGMKGAFFFDLDGDGRFRPGDDFPANAFVGDDGRGVKAWYSPRVIAEANRRGLGGRTRPAHVPTLAESKEFWRYRDAAPSITAAVARCTHLAVVVYANERDHVQAALDHPHILAQYGGFRDAGAKFVRLNPDRAYVEQILTSGPAPSGPRRPARRDLELPDNPAHQVITRANLAGALEPPGLTISPCMQAAVCELADRTQTGRWTPDLESVISP